jgi:hypothetical protein
MAAIVRPGRTRSDGKIFAALFSDAWTENGMDKTQSIPQFALHGGRIEGEQEAAIRVRG